MAVQVESVTFNHAAKTAKVELFVDSTSDVTSGMKVEGVPDDYTLQAGSSAFTANKDLGFLNSAGTWVW